jgi:hypothetical protein
MFQLVPEANTTSLTSSQNHQKRTVAEAGFASASTDQNSFVTQEQQEEVADELYCDIVVKVVGIQYYTGNSGLFFFANGRAKIYDRLGWTR